MALTEANLTTLGLHGAVADALSQVERLAPGLLVNGHPYDTQVAIKQHSVHSPDWEQHPKVITLEHPNEKALQLQKAIAESHYGEPLEQFKVRKSTINQGERPISPNPRPATNEPMSEKVITNPDRPVTSAEAPEGGAADARVDLQGVGGVPGKDTNESASEACDQIDVEGKGDSSCNDVDADSTQDVEKKVEDTEGSGPTSTFPNEGQAAPVDGEAWPKNAAKQGNPPVDPAGNPWKREDVETTEDWETLSIPTQTWTGTEGNGVNKQENPVTNETLEGDAGVKSSKISIAAIRLAELEIELGITTASDKFVRIAELDNESDDALESKIAYVDRLRKVSRKTTASVEAHRVPSLQPKEAPKTASSEVSKEVVTESLFL